MSIVALFTVFEQYPFTITWVSSVKVQKRCSFHKAYVYLRECFK